MKSCDLIIDNVQLASMQPNGQRWGHIEQAVVAIDQGRIVYVGAKADCSYRGNKWLDGQQGWLTPGLIDCHTHLVYGGDRADEFEQRLQGKTYAEIARSGGGIQSTVRATRAASEEDLLNRAGARARRLLEEGVTTVEIKSGYGLDSTTEQAMLKVARQLGEQLPLSVRTTYLGAHALPPEYDNSDSYIDFVCQHMIPLVAEKKLADAVDVFCESIAFSPAQCERVFQAAQQHNLAIKAHVEQLSDLKGAVLASRYRALSVDHIEYLQREDVAALKSAGTVAVLLPGAFYYLNESQKPPVDALRQQGVPIAVATDLNPGSSPLASLLTAMNMACVLFGLTPEEALRGTTSDAAKALGLEHQKGQIATGFDADLCLWPVAHPAELVYGINQIRPQHIWCKGEHVQL